MSKSGDVILGAVEKCGDYLGATPMIYAEAVRRAEEWFNLFIHWDGRNDLGESSKNHEALAVLRRAGGVMGAVENCRIEGDAYGDDSPMAEPHELRVILRESLRYKVTP